ncbi:MAG: cryptochrome/photolyase family protein, partial [Pseudomonadota bacterium]
MAGKTIRFVLGDQLSRNVSSLTDANEGDLIFMCEVWDEATHVRHHKKKLAFIFSAMRHFGEDLNADGFDVDYLKLGEHDAETFTQALKAAVARHGADRVVVTEASEWRVLEAQQSWADIFGIDVEIRPDDRFIATHDDFAKWADGRKELRMEYFYRLMRKKTGYLMDGDSDAPEGGQWNYDKDNREPPKDQMTFPARPDWGVDGITNDVLDMVKSRFDNHFGDLEPFEYPVTRKQATDYLNWFVDKAL